MTPSIRSALERRRDERAAVYSADLDSEYKDHAYTDFKAGQDDLIPMMLKLAEALGLIIDDYGFPYDENIFAIVFISEELIMVGVVVLIKFGLI